MSCCDQRAALAKLEPPAAPEPTPHPKAPPPAQADKRAKGSKATAAKAPAPAPPRLQAGQAAARPLIDAETYTSVASAYQLSNFSACRFVIGGLDRDLHHLDHPALAGPGGQIAHDLARREDLIRDFIIAASNTYGDALVNNEPKMPEISFVDLYAMVSRMRVLTMPRSVACADMVLHSIIETYFAPNWTVADLRELVKGGSR